MIHSTNNQSIANNQNITDNLHSTYYVLGSLNPDQKKIYLIWSIKILKLRIKIQNNKKKSWITIRIIILEA